MAIDLEERERGQAVLRVLAEQRSGRVLDFTGFLDEELRPTDKALQFLSDTFLLDSLLLVDLEDEPAEREERVAVKKPAKRQKSRTA